VGPHARHLTFLLADAGMLRLADRPYAPGAIARSPPAVGRDRERLAADRERAGPATGLCETFAVEQHATVLADEMLRLFERRDGSLPREIEGERVIGRLEDDANPLQRLQHLDAERAD